MGGIHTYKYDNGNIVEELNNGIVQYTYKYDSNGNKIEKNQYLGSQLMEKIKYKYEDNGKTIEEYHYVSSGSLDKKSIYKYHNGNRVEESHYVSGGSLLMWKESCIYDSKGNKIESNIYNINGTGGNSAYMYEYDKTGNWVKCTKFRDDKPETITERIIKYFP